jgi:hypothetical protein
MVEAFVLYAFNPEEDFSVPVARVLIASADFKFFQENDIVGKSKVEWFTEWVLKWIRKECPCLLVPFDGWDFYLNAESLAVIMGQGERIFYLPVVDLTTAPSGVII